MDKLILFVVLTLSFDIAFMTQAYGQNITVTDQGEGVAVIESYTALAVAAGTLVGTIGSIIGVVVVFIRDQKTKQLAQQVGLGMVTFGQKTVESQDAIRKLARAGYELAPEEAKKFLKDNKLDAEHLTERVRKGTEQLEVIKDNLPGDTSAKIRALRKTLPGESWDTRPIAD